MPFTRRRFVQSGTAFLSVPSFLVGCGHARHGGSTAATAPVVPATVAAPAPDNPFLEWFAVDEATIGTVMGRLAANGADYADIYFEHDRYHALALEDEIVSRAIGEWTAAWGSACWWATRPATRTARTSTSRR